jgi:hypothetical protein
MRELRRANEQADAKAAATKLRRQGAADLASIPIAEEESCATCRTWPPLAHTAGTSPSGVARKADQKPLGACNESPSRADS